jgi:chromosome segregation ATPase
VDIIGFVAFWRGRNGQESMKWRLNMDTVVNAKDDLSSYRSPSRVLADWFRKSRNNWKQKYVDLKAEIKRFRNRANDLQKSRNHWKELAATHQQQLAALQAQVEQLKAQVLEVETDQGFKNGATPVPTRPR